MAVILSAKEVTATAPSRSCGERLFSGGRGSCRAISFGSAGASPSRRQGRPKGVRRSNHTGVPMPPTGSSPALFFDTVSAFQRTEALRAAIELDLFTHVASGRRTVEEIATACGAAPRGVRILADYVTVLG